MSPIQKLSKEAKDLLDHLLQNYTFLTKCLHLDLDSRLEDACALCWHQTLLFCAMNVYKLETNDAASIFPYLISKSLVISTKIEIFQLEFTSHV